MTLQNPQRSDVDSAPEGWVDAHGDVLFRFAMVRVRNRTMAEELVQETFVAALTGRGEFRAAAAEQTWLVGILKHKILDHFRKNQRERATGMGGEGEEMGVDVVLEQAFTKGGHWRKGPARWEVDASVLMERAEFWEAFSSCVEGLPAQMGKAFTLRMLDEEDPQVVCQVLSISATNLWMLLHRARTRLRRCLEAKWFAPETRDQESRR